MSWAIALVVVAAVAVVVRCCSRREGPPDPRLLAAGPGVGVEPDERVAGLGDLEAAGEAMIDAGYSVTGVRTALNDIARVNEKPLTEIVVLPTALFVSTRRSGEMRTGTGRPATSPGAQPIEPSTTSCSARSVPSRIRTPYAAAALARARTPCSPTLCASGGLAVLLDASWTASRSRRAGVPRRDCAAPRRAHQAPVPPAGTSGLSLPGVDDRLTLTLGRARPRGARRPHRSASSPRRPAPTGVIEWPPARSGAGRPPAACGSSCSPPACGRGVAGWRAAARLGEAQNRSGRWTVARGGGVRRRDRRLQGAGRLHRVGPPGLTSVRRPGAGDALRRRALGHGGRVA